jgi:hypothetical protein
MIIPTHVFDFISDVWRVFLECACVFIRRGLYLTRADLRFFIISLKFRFKILYDHEWTCLDDLTWIISFENKLRED